MNKNEEKAKTILERLSFIKYLYSVAIEQSKTTEPGCYISVLLFHDAIELFFELSKRHLNTKREKNFMDYFEKIKNKLNGKELQQKEAVKALNNARVALKHGGRLPNLSDLERYRVTTSNFFEENTPIVFNLDFLIISLADLILNNEAKKQVKLAEKALKQGNYKESLIQSKSAFRTLLNDFSSEKNPLNKGLAFISDFQRLLIDSQLRVNETLIDHNFRKDPEIEKMKELLGYLLEKTDILGIGIDYLKYAKFQAIFNRDYPPRLLFPPNTNIIVYQKNESNSIFTKYNCEFCIQFVIETALQIQRLELSFKHLNNEEMNEKIR